ncbi:MAG: hypothetical protein ACLFP2_04490 [Candidatus Woesearchaeota archaeon]
MSDMIFLLKIGCGILAFVLIVRFLFSMSTQEHYQRTPAQIRKEIEKFKGDLSKLKQKIPSSEYGQLMDDLMEEYYKANDDGQKKN